MTNLAELLSKNTIHIGRRGEEYRNQVLQNISTLMLETPYECEKEDFKKGLNILAKDYFRAHIGEKYSLLSPEIFKLKRKICIEPDQVQIVKKGTIKEVVVDEECNIPLIALAEYGEPIWKHKTTINVEVNDGYNKKKSVTEFNVSAKIPLLPREIKAKASEALAFAYDVCAASLRNPTVRNYLAKEVGNPKKIHTHIAPELYVMWIPTEEALDVVIAEVEVPDPDPALLLGFEKDFYIVDTWNIRDEKPLEHFLREYSIGSQKRLFSPE